MVFQSDSRYHLQSEQTTFNRQTDIHSLNSACSCHSQILDNEVISEWKGNIEKNLSIEYGFPSGNRLMGILRIHLKIYLPECIELLTRCFFFPFVFSVFHFLSHFLHSFLFFRFLDKNQHAMSTELGILQPNAQSPFQPPCFLDFVSVHGT